MSDIDFGFWQKLKKMKADNGRPIFVLAPMSDVTDAAFRQIIATYSHMGENNGGPDAMWTEFVSADGLASAGREILIRDLAYSPAERPIVAQLFTSHPDKMFEAAKLVASLGFDGLDINMGCPDRSIEKQGAGAGLIKNPALAREVIEAAREGVRAGAVNGSSGIPVSVKTRLGYNSVDIDDWLGSLLALKLPALTVHLRTRKEMSDVAAHWELMPEIVRLRDKISPETLILGNGDVTSLEQGEKLVRETGCDGVMIGRGIFGNPWFFDRTSAKEKDPKEKLKVMLEHTLLFEKLLGDIKNFAIMKKHYKAYVNGWDGAKELRIKLMAAESAADVRDIISSYAGYPQP